MTTTSIQYQAWDTIADAAKIGFYGKRYVWTSTGLVEWDGPLNSRETDPVQAELEAIAAKYPARDSHGYVIAFYNCHPLEGRQSGPHVTIDDAEEAKRHLDLGPYNTVCGHVFTSRGTIVRES